MLRKIVKIDGVGALYRATPQAVELAKVTLIFAENGRGKSTLSDVLASLQGGRDGILERRATLGKDERPQVHLRAIRDGKEVSFKYEGGAWNQKWPDICVFNQEFVDRNVHTGGYVRADHREALLELAIGEAAYEKKLELEKLVRDQAEATKQRTAAIATITGAAGGRPLKEFLALPLVPDAQGQVERLSAQIQAVGATEEVQRRPELALIAVPSIDFGLLKDTLSAGLDELHIQARERAKSHISSLKNGAEEWIRQGLSYVQDDKCPFCTKTLGNDSMLEHYRAYFDAAYRDLLGRIDRLVQVTGPFLSNSVLEHWSHASELNLERAKQWRAVGVEVELPNLNVNRITAEARSIRDELNELVAKKRNQPLVRVDTSPCESLESRLNALVKQLEAMNQLAGESNAQIRRFKKDLGETGVTKLREERDRLLACLTRYSPTAMEAVRLYEEAEAKRATAETEKLRVRAELNAVTNAALQGFQDGVNELLRRFGAAFRVVNLKQNYVGTGDPRSEYAIELRNEAVSASDQKGDGVTFSTLLSEGDKRTLALAFFLARFGREDVACTKVFVLDDVFASLDAGRRVQTMWAIVQLSKVAPQVIVLAHDRYFIKGLHERLKKIKDCNIKALQLARGPEDFTEICACDIEDLCASDNYRRYMTVFRFINGERGVDKLTVAKSLRPLLEGHLHARFPAHLKKGMLGTLIEQIRIASSESPLALLQECVPKLITLSDYISTFHHDDEDGGVPEGLHESELLSHCRQVMTFLHEGHL